MAASSVSRGGRRKKGAYFPIAPSPFYYLLKSPSTLLAFSKRNPFNNSISK
jgi:hypothetical protein